MKSDFLPSKTRSGKIRLLQIVDDFPPLPPLSAQTSAKSISPSITSPLSFTIPDFVQNQFDALESQMGLNPNFGDRNIAEEDSSSVHFAGVTSAATAHDPLAVSVDGGIAVASGSASATKLCSGLKNQPVVVVGTKEYLHGMKILVTYLSECNTTLLSGITNVNSLHILNTPCGKSAVDCGTKLLNLSSSVTFLERIGKSSLNVSESIVVQNSKPDKVAPSPKWSSLFTSKPKNAGRYISRNFEIGNG